jgi:regulator of protease activity HflC (stomatin/prohibitin superfamily)
MIDTSSLLEWIKEKWERYTPIYIIPAFEKAVILRNGNIHRILGGGLYFKLPYFDEINTAHTSITTLTTHPQSLTTKDGKAIIVRAIVKYNVEDVKIFLIEVMDAVDALSDITQGVIKEVITSRTWEEVVEMKDLIIKNRVIKEAETFGIKVHAVTVTDLVIVKNIRLIR